LGSYFFSGAVHLLHQEQLLDLSVNQGDGTTTAAKKDGDNLGNNWHKHLRGDKEVALAIASATSSRHS
jgi:hypothetical protein